MEHIIPDLKWYTEISKSKDVLPRCPFASVHGCPRFYQSLSLLGYAGSTKINIKEDQRLKKKWEKSDLWPTTREQETSISGSPGEPHLFANFCPEVAFERFGYFSVLLARYADNIDQGIEYKRLGKERAPITDWRWYWSHIKPMHYTECPLYSPLELEASLPGKSSNQNVPKGVWQAIMYILWRHNSFWRNVGLIVIILIVCVFFFWQTFPDEIKKNILITLFNLFYNKK